MKRFLLLLSAVLLTGVDKSSAATPSISDPLQFKTKQKLHLPSNGGQQGIATDGRFFYVQNTLQLIKYNLEGTLIKAGPTLKLHHGGIVYVDNRIYAAVSNCDSGGTKKHYVHVYSAESLELVRTHDIGDYFSVCAGGIAHRKGHFFVAESFFDNDHLDRIVEFDRDFNFLRQHVVNFKSPFGVQGLEFLPDLDQFQVHSHGKEFYRINARFENDSLRKGKAEFDLQDLARLNAATLIVNHRQTDSVLFIDLKMRGDDRSIHWRSTSKMAAPEAIQAAAADEKFIYAIASEKLAKYDRESGRRLATSTGKATHLNSGFIWKGKLLCAHSNFPNTPQRSDIKVLDPVSMKLELFKELKERGGSLTWVVRHEGHWWCNFARYGLNNHKTFLVQYNDEWQELGRWTYPKAVIDQLGLSSLSGGIWHEGKLLVTGHDKPEFYRLELPQTGTELRFIGTQSVPFTGQGFAADPHDNGLVGINRARRQIIFVKSSDNGVQPSK